MGWMKNLYEKIKPYLWIPILILIAYLVTSNIVGTNRFNDQQRTFERTVSDLNVVSGEIRDGLSDISDIKAGVAGITETSGDLRRISDELRVTSSNLEQAILGLGDTSTESGLYADRLYRISRRLAESEQENTK